MFWEKQENPDMNWEKSDFQGMNPWVSGHVKQTPHDPNMIWASNQYLIVFKGRTVDMKTLTLIEEPTEEVHLYIFLPFKFENHQKSNVSTSNFRSWLRRRMSLKGFWTRQNNEIIRPQKAFLWRICNICANLIYFQLSLNIFTIWSVTIMRTTWYGDDCSQIYMNSMHLVSKIEYLDLTWQFF